MKCSHIFSQKKYGIIDFGQVLLELPVDLYRTDNKGQFGDQIPVISRSDDTILQASSLDAISFFTVQYIIYFRVYQALGELDSLTDPRESTIVRTLFAMYTKQTNVLR